MKTTTTLFIGIAGLSGCGPLPVSTASVEAPRSQPCARIFWRDLGSARDINAAIATEKPDARLVRTAYAPPELDDKASMKEIERWLQAHLAVQVRSCPASAPNQ
ncbi:MAG TPA: hypothetical protein VEU32_02865 [Burkholderiales bacterium]|nr:hypothetical protein [Burkholderiales bacterium]